jgi:predicted  nucleic acid-binding Zn-ribbon protein
MQAQIETLVKLQAVELERTRLTKAAHELPGQIVQAKAELAAAEQQAATATAALAAEETLRANLERETDAHRKKAARLRAQQDSITTPAQAEAVDHELRFAESEAERLENEDLASMERSEAQEDALAAARALIESRTAALETTRKRAGHRQAEIDRELAVLNTEREALRPLIDAANLARFDRLCGSRGTGLARIENQRCTGCSMGVRPQTWNQLQAGELMVCDSCSRLIYWDPAIAAPAPVPPDPVAGASGRAIRK